MRALLCFVFITICSTVSAEVVMHCGASLGKSYFITDPIFNPEPSSWQEDGMSNGRIILTKEEDDWDILFGDALGSTGYRSDGASVVLLAVTDRFLRIGAFHQNYADIYNFDFAEKSCLEFK